MVKKLVKAARDHRRLFWVCSTVATWDGRGGCRSPPPASAAHLQDRRGAKMPLSQADIEEERTHFANVIATFQQYAPYAVRATPALSPARCDRTQCALDTAPS